jgi:hypothetical protein
MVGEIVFLVTKIPCNSITKRQNELLNVRVNYTYKGPARTGRLGAVVTQKTAVTEFDEIGSTRKEFYVNFPASDTAVSSYTNITGMPLSGCEPKSGYGVKVYALDLDGKPEWGCLNVLTVTAPPVVYKGTISRKELEYDETRGTIPVSNVPQGKRGLVHIWGRNDMTTTQRMGIWWQVKNPAGTVVEEYSTWEATPYTSPGDTHEFIGGRFTLDKVGTFTIDVALYMNPSAPEIVDRYTGTLCTVAAVGEYTLAVSVSPAVGWVSKSPDKPTYSQGEVVTLTAYLDSWAIGYYVLDHWTVNGVTKTGNPITVTMDGNKSVVCYFRTI